MKIAQRLITATFAAAVAITAVGCASQNETSKTAGEYVDDAVITTKVKAAFAADRDQRRNLQGRRAAVGLRR